MSDQVRELKEGEQHRAGDVVVHLKDEGHVEQRLSVTPKAECSTCSGRGYMQIVLRPGAAADDESARTMAHCNCVLRRINAWRHRGGQ
jgi:hypothetical protein